MINNFMVEYCSPARLKLFSGDDTLKIELFSDGSLCVWTRDKETPGFAGTTLTKEEMLHIANRLSVWAGGVTQQITGDNL